jgi:hypothetical protein
LKETVVKKAYVVLAQNNATHSTYIHVFRQGKKQWQYGLNYPNLNISQNNIKIYLSRSKETIKGGQSRQGRLVLGTVRKHFFTGTTWTEISV